MPTSETCQKNEQLGSIFTALKSGLCSFKSRPANDPDLIGIVPIFASKPQKIGTFRLSEEEIRNIFLGNKVCIFDVFVVNMLVCTVLHVMYHLKDWS